MSDMERKKGINGTVHIGLASIILTFALILACNGETSAQCQGAKDIEKWGTFDNWIVREFEESSIIGGQTRYLYEIATGDTVKGRVPYKNAPHCVWSNSNVFAIVSGVTKGSCSVFPEKRGDGYCARLETRLEKIKAAGIININVIASGTIYLGEMLEPIRNTKNPQSKLVSGIPFTDKPAGITFDYKVLLGNNRIRANGLAIKELHDNDYADCIVMLQKRWEDKDGNVFAARVGTAFMRITETDTVWNNNYFLRINYGDITDKPFYRDYMKLIPEEESNYTRNSKGEMKPIHEISWGTLEDKPTHIIIRFSSSYGEAYVGDPTNKFWIDNVKISY